MVSKQTPNLKLSPLATSDIIGHVTIGFVIYGFLYVANLKQPSTLHGCQDMVLLRFWGHDVDLLASRYVISRDHSTRNMGFPIGGQFEPTIVSRTIVEILSLKFWGHALDPLGSRDVIGHVTIGLLVCSFL